MSAEASAAERDAMLRAVQLSELALGRTSPNPIVGCVVLDAGGRPAGEGFHAVAGGPHAEVVALRAAGDHARGGTAVVTLEPCRHTGRTGPCTEALLAAGIARVVYAVADPSPAAGGGGQLLRSAGVDVQSGTLEALVAASNEAWLHRVRTGRPFVTWKYAATLDGLVAAADGSSRWITGAAARADVHLLRSRSDAIVVGTGTVLADDPELTARGVDADRQPLRVVIGRRPVPPGARILDDAAETVVLATHDPADALAELGRRDVVSVLLEGGPTLAAAFVAAGLVDKVIGYLAPALLGAGRPLVGALGIATVGDILRLHVSDVRLVGDDVRITARVAATATRTQTAGE